MSSNTASKVSFAGAASAVVAAKRLNTSSPSHVKVAVRVRPFNDRELADPNVECVVDMQDTQTILRGGPKGNRDTKVFNFDHSFWSMCKDQDHDFTDQLDVFKHLGHDVIVNAFAGYNTCIFAYGQTGSGKTHTMMGRDDSKGEGLIPRMCNVIFDRSQSLCFENKNLKCHIEVSYMEIYNERVRDLLDASGGDRISGKKKALKVREHKLLGTYVEGLARVAVADFHKMKRLMIQGNKIRTTRATKMNNESSRSHAIFMVHVNQATYDPATKKTGEKASRLCLVDLAGSERQSKSGALGEKLKEGANINKSLTVLDNLGGNSKTVMLATISPAKDNYDETLSTLRYADRAKRITNKAIINEDSSAKLIRQLREELNNLRSAIGTGDQVSSDNNELEELRRKLAEREALYNEMNMTWEEKLRLADLRILETESLLDNLSAALEKEGQGVKMQTRLPHFLSLSDDPLSTEVIIYPLKPGMTRVGRDGQEPKQDIEIFGYGLENEHAIVESSEGNLGSFMSSGKIHEMQMKAEAERLLEQKERNAAYHKQLLKIQEDNAAKEKEILEQNRIQAEKSAKLKKAKDDENAFLRQKILEMEKTMKANNLELKEREERARRLSLSISEQEAKLEAEQREKERLLAEANTKLEEERLARFAVEEQASIKLKKLEQDHAHNENRILKQQQVLVASVEAKLFEERERAGEQQRKIDQLKAEASREKMRLNNEATTAMKQLELETSQKLVEAQLTIETLNKKADAERIAREASEKASKKEKERIEKEMMQALANVQEKAQIELLQSQEHLENIRREASIERAAREAAESTAQKERERIEKEKKEAEDALQKAAKKQILLANEKLEQSIFKLENEKELREAAMVEAAEEKKKILRERALAEEKLREDAIKRLKEAETKIISLQEEASLEREQHKLSIARAAAKLAEMEKGQITIHKQLITEVELKAKVAEEQILLLNERSEKERMARIKAEASLQSKLDNALELCEQLKMEAEVERNDRQLVEKAAKREREKIEAEKMCAIAKLQLDADARLKESHSKLESAMNQVSSEALAREMAEKAAAKERAKIEAELVKAKKDIKMAAEEQLAEANEKLNDTLSQLEYERQARKEATSAAEADRIRLEEELKQQTKDIVEESQMEAQVLRAQAKSETERRHQLEEELKKNIEQHEQELKQKKNELTELSEQREYEQEEAKSREQDAERQIQELSELSEKERSARISAESQLQKRLDEALLLCEKLKIEAEAERKARELAEKRAKEIADTEKATIEKEKAEALAELKKDTDTRLKESEMKLQAALAQASLETSAREAAEAAAARERKDIEAELNATKEDIKMAAEEQLAEANEKLNDTLSQLEYERQARKEATSAAEADRIRLEEELKQQTKDIVEESQMEAQVLRAQAKSETERRHQLEEELKKNIEQHEQELKQKKNELTELSEQREYEQEEAKSREQDAERQIQELSELSEKERSARISAESQLQKRLDEALLLCEKLKIEAEAERKARELAEKRAKEIADTEKATIEKEKAEALAELKKDTDTRLKESEMKLQAALAQASLETSAREAAEAAAARERKAIEAELNATKEDIKMAAEEQLAEANEKLNDTLSQLEIKRRGSEAIVHAAEIDREHLEFELKNYAQGNYESFMERESSTHEWEKSELKEWEVKTRIQKTDNPFLPKLQDIAGNWGSGYAHGDRYVHSPGKFVTDDLSTRNDNNQDNTYSFDEKFIAWQEEQKYLLTKMQKEAEEADNVSASIKEVAKLKRALSIHRRKMEDQAKRLREVSLKNTDANNSAKEQQSKQLKEISAKLQEKSKIASSALERLDKESERASNEAKARKSVELENVSLKARLESMKSAIDSTSKQKSVLEKTASQIDEKSPKNISREDKEALIAAAMARIKAAQAVHLQLKSKVASVPQQSKKSRFSLFRKKNGNK
eukprot:UC4_evm4s945